MSIPPDVQAYLEQVRAALGDLPAEERDELLADVEVSLVEGAADSVDPIEQRLGSPEAFARELRAAAGLTGTAAVGSGRRSLRDRARALAHHQRVGEGREIARELVPVWWFVRGYVAIVALSLFLGVPWSPTFVGIPSYAEPFGGLFIVAAAIAASVAIGRRERDGLLRRRWLTAVNLAIVIAALPVAVQIGDGRSSLQVAEAYFQEPVVEHGTVTNMGGEVTNIYPYSRDGKLLFDVLLYDQHGQPLQVGPLDRSQDPDRRYVVSEAGEPLIHVFPIRYFEPGTTRIARPDAGPDIEVPAILTPPIGGDAKPKAKTKRQKKPGRR